MAVRLREQREHALLWRQLTTIALDAPLEGSQPGLLRQTADPELLGGLCQTLRFGPMTRRRCSMPPACPIFFPPTASPHEPAQHRSPACRL